VPPSMDVHSKCDMFVYVVTHVHASPYEYHWCVGRTEMTGGIENPMALERLKIILNRMRREQSSENQNQ
jgi:hypothetical protein